MALSARELEAVVGELASLVGARVEAVHVHAERALTLALFSSSGPATLLLSAEPGRARLHAAERRPPAPATPFPLQAVLRRELRGARLAALSAEAFLGVRMVFERAEGRMTLLAELSDRDGQLLLLSGEGRILTSAGRGRAGERTLAPGALYEPPLAPAKGPRERAPLVPAGGRFPISLAIEERDRALEEARALEEGRSRLKAPVRAALARAERALAKLAEEAARVPAAESDRRAADLLKQNLRAVERGARAARLTEWTDEGPREVTVRLDPALSPRENMERLYRHYRRIVESAVRVADRIAEVRSRREELVALRDAIARAELRDLERLEREARRLGAGPRTPKGPRRERPGPLPPYRLFRAEAGTALLVGRSAEKNDELTVSVAHGNDLWLHARGCGGAHVVARLEKGKAPDGETLLDAAHLAAHFSDARGEPLVEVVATRAKYVRKVRGSPPGAVTYSQERTLHLRVERARLERLLASEEAPGQGAPRGPKEAP